MLVFSRLFVCVCLFDSVRSCFRVCLRVVSFLCLVVCLSVWPFVCLMSFC